MAGFEDFEGLFTILIAVVSIVYPLIVGILRQSIRANEEWIRICIVEAKDKPKNQRKLRGKALGYENMTEMLLTCQNGLSVLAFLILVASIWIVVGSRLLSGDYEGCVWVVVVAISVLVSLLFLGLLIWSFVSTSLWRANHMTRIDKHFRTEPLSQRHRKWLIFWEWF